MKTRILRCMLAIAFAATAASAQQMNYQGRLTDNAGAPRPGPQATLTFSMWTLPSGGTKVWGDFLINADLIDGRFSVKLGTATGDDGNGNLLSTTFATNPGPRYLEIKVGTDAPLPRQEVLPAPTALHAVIAGTVPDGAIGTPQLANLAVTGDKIADGTIPIAKLTGAGANFWDGNGTNVWRTGGNVGIGTVTPAIRLHVSNGDSGQPSFFNTTLLIEDDSSHYLQMNSPNGAECGILFGRDSSALSGQIMYNSQGAMRFHTSGSQRMHISQTGDVGIGTSAPSAKLDVAGNIRENGQHVPSSEEDLRIVRGNVRLDGTIESGTGFAVTGLFPSATPIITFVPPFADVPAVTVNARTDGANQDNLVNLRDLTSSSVQLVIVDENGTGNVIFEPSAFSFIAIGAR